MDGHAQVAAQLEEIRIAVAGSAARALVKTASTAGGTAGRSCESATGLPTAGILPVSKMYSNAPTANTSGACIRFFAGNDLRRCERRHVGRSLGVEEAPQLLDANA